jgi:selenide, water dikinase
LLSEVLMQSTATRAFSDLLVGTESSDDAAVYRINDTQAIVATTDFFMPIVDDPYDFGRIAATNAISDVYAMGATPFLALGLLGMPVGKLPAEVIHRIVAGGRSVCETAGIPIAGGHSIDSLEPIYGLVALGLVHPDKVKRNNAARAGDVLILGKALGVGIMSAAIKKGELHEKAYQQLLETTTQLNTPGIALAEMPGVHALTDVTGFGLVGHLLGICRGSGLKAELIMERVPVLSAAHHLVQQGFATGASERNWASYRHEVTVPALMHDWQKKLLTDPQTSGGLLVACEPAAAAAVLDIFREQGFKHAAEIGRLVAGAPSVVIA